MTNEQILKLLRNGIAGLEGSTAGLSLEEVKRKYGLREVVKLASNENPLGPSKKAIKAATEAAKMMNIYSDPTGFGVRSAIAERYGVGVDQVLHGNGSSELITFIGAAFISQDDECIIHKPAYHRYQEIVEIMGGKNIFSPLRDYRVDLNDMASKVGGKTKLIVIVNPNNPTGDIVRRAEVEAFLDNTGKGKIIVLDEAYGEYVEDEEYPNSLELISRGYNIIALRTFSKAYGMAGTRLGYAISRPEIIRYLDKVRPVFNLNRFAQVAGIEAINDKEHLNRSVQLIWQEKRYYYEELDKLGLSYVPTSANFIFVDTGVDDLQLRDMMVKKGVIIRPMTPWGYQGCIRITIGTHDQNERAVAGLKEALEELRS